jgi:hypothetical protein
VLLCCLWVVVLAETTKKTDFVAWFPKDHQDLPATNIIVCADFQMSTPLSHLSLCCYSRLLLWLWWIGSEILIAWHIKELQINVTKSPALMTANRCAHEAVPIEHWWLELVRARLGQDPNQWQCK